MIVCAWGCDVDGLGEADLARAALERRPRGAQSSASQPRHSNALVAPERFAYGVCISPIVNIDSKKSFADRRADIRLSAP